MKLYIPKLKDCIRLTEDITLPATGDHWRHSLKALAFRVANPGQPYRWQEAEKLTQVTLVAGTVLQFKRYFISAHAQENRVTVAIYAHPERHLTPRKLGGLATMNELTFDMTVDQLNEIEYEKVII